MSNNLIMLIGDSITEGFDTGKYLPEFNIINNGVSADTTVECYSRILPEKFGQIPSKIFICIGTNDIAQNRNDDFILDNIEKINNKIRTLSSRSEIFLTSLFPTRFNELRTNDRILLFNKKLKKLSEKFGCFYFDIHDYFEDSEGNLKEIYTEDGLHLNANAYQKWAQILSEFLNRDS